MDSPDGDILFSIADNVIKPFDKHLENYRTDFFMSLFDMIWLLKLCSKATSTNIACCFENVMNLAFLTAWPGISIYLYVQFYVSAYIQVYLCIVGERFLFLFRTPPLILILVPRHARAHSSIVFKIAKHTQEEQTVVSFDTISWIFTVFVSFNMFSTGTVVSQTDPNPASFLLPEGRHWTSETVSKRFSSQTIKRMGSAACSLRTHYSG